MRSCWRVTLRAAATSAAVLPSVQSRWRSPSESSNRPPPPRAFLDDRSGISDVGFGGIPSAPGAYGPSPSTIDRASATNAWSRGDACASNQIMPCSTKGDGSSMAR